MRVAMAVLAIGAIGAGLVQIPEVDDVVDNFLRPTFADSPLYEPHTRDGLLIFGLCLGTVLGLSGIAIAYRIWVKQPSIAVARCASASRRCTSCSRTSGTSTS